MSANSRVILGPGIYKYQMPIDKITEAYSLVSTYLVDFFVAGRIITKDNSSYGQAVNLNIRDAGVIATNDSIGCHPDDPVYSIDKILDEHVQPCLNDYTKIFSIEDIQQNHSWIYMKYGVNGFFNNHKDDGASTQRTVSLIAYLNDDYSGGEIEFPHFNVRLKPKIGELLIFSAAYPYIHNIKTITSGTRYAAVKWYEFIKPS